MPLDPDTQLEVFGANPFLFEDSTATYRATLVDESGNPIIAPNALLMSLFDKDTGTYINNRRGQDIFNTNGGAFDSATGQLTLTLSAQDNKLLDQTKSEEDHILRLDWTYNSSTARGHDAVILRVKNLKKLGA